MLIPFPVLLETYCTSLQERSEAIADERYALLRRLPAAEIWEVDKSTLLTAARLKAQFRISLADALIAALAVRSSAILVHKDPEYGMLADRVRQGALSHK